MMIKSLFAKLLLYFTVLILFSLTTVGVTFYLQSSREIDRQSEQFAAQVIHNTSYQTDLYLQTYERISTSILLNNYVKKFLDIDETDYYGRYEYSSNIIKNVFTQTFNTYPQINMIYVLGNNGNSLFYDGQGRADVSALDTEAQLETLKRMTPDNGAISLLKMSVYPQQSDSTITLARKIRGVSSYEPNGILAIEVGSSKLEEVWRNVELAKNGYFFILDDSGRTIYYPERRLPGTSEGDSFIEAIAHRTDEPFTQTVAGEDWLFVSRQSSYTGWRLVMALPLSELRSPISTIRLTSMVVGGIVLIVALWLAYRFSRQVTGPIRLLKSGMRETEKGNWKLIEEAVSSRDEVGGLVRSYNLMVNRLEEMINRVYVAELSSSRQELALQTLENEKQMLEYQALQLQINPHFLYNTLETINCYAIVQDSEEISEMVDAMAFMLRYALQTNLEEITLVNELNHVRNYMLILKHRIQREFELEIAVPPELLLEKMVRMTLQPLTENIFQHAFPQGVEPGHVIRIGAAYEGDDFVVTVEDNGAGIKPMRLAMLREQIASGHGQSHDDVVGGRSRGIGIMNVHRRIRMVYGGHSGLELRSVAGQGTKIVLRMRRHG